ncbi:MAG: hypothetical protein MJZ11_11405 [Lachnospiraceae bacterium]|nr:hypothetical protein [Lachnospiraceae bacterium]
MIGRELLTELIDGGYKFSENDIIFITKDREGKLIWLERGNENVGLVHIIANHKQNFEEAYGIQEGEIALYLYNAITNGTIIGSIPSKIKGGLDRIYEYDGCYYTFVGMGNNGFIVTSFPTRK